MNKIEKNKNLDDNIMCSSYCSEDLIGVFNFHYRFRNS